MLNVIEKSVVVSTPFGNADGYFFHPEARGGATQFPGVVYYTDIWGIREANKQAAKELASHGYAVLFPNIFYRGGKPPLYPFPHKFGEERTMARIRELTSPFNPETIEGDCKAYVQFLRDQPAVSSTGMAAVGFCMTGAWALRTAAASPVNIATAISFHGGNLYTDNATSPHLQLPRVRAKLYFGHADKDASMPEPAIEKLTAALEEWGGVYESVIYDGASHGWTQTDKDSYNPIQAKKAHDKLLDVLAAGLSV